MVDGVYGILNAIFGPIMTMDPMFSVVGISIIITFLITVIYRFLSNPRKMKELRDKAKEMSAKAKELQKTNPEEAKKMTSEVLSLTNKQMMANMKPLLGTMLLVALFFPWMAEQYVGPVVNLPFTVPFFGADLGWLVWYILISVPTSQVFRKLLGVDL